jgi:hypothetical protein
MSQHFYFIFEKKKDLFEKKRELVPAHGPFLILESR